jgi:hypothetical protein
MDPARAPWQGSMTTNESPLSSQCSCTTLIWRVFDRPRLGFVHDLIACVRDGVRQKGVKKDESGGRGRLDPDQLPLCPVPPCLALPLHKTGTSERAKVWGVGGCDLEPVTFSSVRRPIRSGASMFRRAVEILRARIETSQKLAPIPRERLVL